MNIVTKAKGEVNIIGIEGNISAGDEFSIAEKFEEIIYADEQKIPKFIIDMKKVPYINSAVLGIFLNLYKYATSKKGRIVFVNLTPEVENIMNITKLTSIFEMYSTVEEALESFQY